MMFISNPESLSSDSYFYCKEKFGEYLINKYQIPLLAIKGDKYLFANTDMLKLALSDIPWYIKLLYK